MIVLDSSGWVEHFIDASRAPSVAQYLEDRSGLLVPTVILYEVYRQLIKKIGPEEVLFAVTQMTESLVVSLDGELALYAAELSLRHKLGTVDAVIYATAQTHNAKIFTFDNDFRDLPGCTVIDSTNK